MMNAHEVHMLCRLKNPGGLFGSLDISSISYLTLEVFTKCLRINSQCGVLIFPIISGLLKQKGNADELSILITFHEFN